MRTLTRWEPGRDVAGLRDEMPRLLTRMFGRDAVSPVAVGAFTPRIDLEETVEAWRVYVDLPGVSPDDVQVEFEGGVLTVSGERPFYEGADAQRFNRIERHFGRFHRAIRLPDDVDVDGIVARYDEGMLEITVPRHERARPRRVDVRAAA